MHSVLKRISSLAIPCLAALVCASACSNYPESKVPEDLYARDVSGGIHDIEPVRGKPGPLRLHVDGDEYQCSMCHEGFSGDLTQQALEGTHAAIEFDHGLNLRCLNCHHPENSDVFVQHDGSEIAGDNPTQLCAKCHGPHYKEWRLGIHGRANGSWNPELGEQNKLDCIQCHNPHRPRFQLMEPDPPQPLTRFEKYGHEEESEHG